MNLSSLIAPGSAILPFAVVLALCIFLLSLPSGEGARITNSSLVNVPQPIEAPASPPLSTEEPLEMNFGQAESVEVGSSLPVVAAPAVDTTSDAVSAMATWWAQRERQPQAALPKAAVSARQYRRHRGVSRRDLGCPPSVCLGAAEKSVAPDSRRDPLL
jgi:hypothetical protein